VLSFEAEFNAPDLSAERSLLLCYEASLPYFERALLHGLQRAGVGSVTVIVDHTDLSQSHADLSAVTRAGVDYFLTGMRLPGWRAAFHAKLYLFVGVDKARLIVASANLTPSGGRTNLEVVDRLHLTSTGSGDRDAFESYLQLLAALPRLDPSLSAETKREIELTTSPLRRWLTVTPASTAAAPKFLHNADTALLTQLLGQVSPDLVKEIIVVSPFYDSASAAIIELADAYSNARISLIKNSIASGDLNGSALLPLGDRISVERLDSIEDRARRLHAKVLLLWGPRDAWIVAGSANLTAPAWLRSAFTGGNLEAVTLRHSSTKGRKKARTEVGIDRLLEKLVRVPIPHAALSYIAPVEDEIVEYRTITIHSARAEPGLLLLRCAPGDWAVQSTKFSAYLASQDHSTAANAVLRPGPSNEAIIEIACASTAVEYIALSDLAVVITLEACPAGGTRWIGRSWLEKPDYLRLSARARVRRHALAIMSRSLVVSDVHLHRVAEWLLYTSTSLAGELLALTSDSSEKISLSPNRRGQPSIAGDTTGESAQSRDDELLIEMQDWEEFVDELDAVPAPSGITPSRGGALARIDAYLRGTTRLIAVLFDQELVSTAGMRRSLPGRRETTLAEFDDQVDEPSPDPSAEADQLLKASAEDMGKAVARILRVKPVPSTVGRVADAVEVLLAYLFRLELHAKLWDRSAAAECTQARRSAWRSVWSVDGWETGRCAGWMVRALVDPSTSDAVRTAFEDPERIARLASVLAAGEALEGMSGRVPASIIVGLSLASGFTDLTVAGPLSTRLRNNAALLTAPFHSLLSPNQVLETLQPASLADTAGAAVARPWLRVAAALASGGDQRNLQLSAMLEDEDRDIRRLADRCLRQIKGGRPISTVNHRDGLGSCAECNVNISREKLQRLSEPGAATQSCDLCGALLSPVAWNDPLCARLLATLMTPGTENPGESSASLVATPLSNA
jgi:hypothetical protein